MKTFINPFYEIMHSKNGMIDQKIRWNQVHNITTCHIHVDRLCLIQVKILWLDWNQDWLGILDTTTTAIYIGLLVTGVSRCSVSLWNTQVMFRKRREATKSDKVSQIMQVKKYPTIHYYGLSRHIKEYPTMLYFGFPRHTKPIIAYANIDLVCLGIPINIAIRECIYHALFLFCSVIHLQPTDLRR